MKEMKYLSEYDVINAAWKHYLDLWCEFKERAEKYEKEHCKKNEILEYRVKKFYDMMEELHDILVEMEKEMKND